MNDSKTKQIELAQAHGKKQQAKLVEQALANWKKKTEQLKAAKENTK